MIVVIIILIILLVLCCAVGIGLMCFVNYPKRPTYEEALEIELSKGYIEDFDSLMQEECNLTMEDGYLLHGILLKHEEPTKKYVIVTHGYMYNRLGSIKYALIFYRQGYNVYLYDLRHFGANQKTFCSMGKYEPRDIVCIAKQLRERFGSDIEIGLHGESLGAASSILALGLDTSFSFCVADCPFSDCGLLFEQKVVSMFHLPAFTSHLGSIAQLIFHGYRYDKIVPMNSFKTNTTTPVCFFHGKDDDFIPPMHSERMYEVVKAYKEIHFIDGAKHAQSLEVDKSGYTEKVIAFLNHL